MTPLPISSRGVRRAARWMSTKRSTSRVRGKVVDKRADIWAFGSVLYEMLTGRAPFPGETVTDVIAAVVKNDPDWSGLPPDTAAHPPVARALPAEGSARATA